MRKYFRTSILLTLIFSILTHFSFAQNNNFTEPREEVLLNGLKVLIWQKANTGKVSVNIRIHKGAAFDPKGKEGTMAMLSEILFPEESIKTFFEEDLEGSLEIITTHDFVQINTTAKASEFRAVMETISAAVATPQIDKETFAKIKPRHIKKLTALEKDSNYIADEAVLKRLYGNYPYGRPVNGTLETIENIDFAELLFTKRKFLTSDNATLTISGDIDPNYAYRAARRLFGTWQKSVKKIEANFRVPDAPKTIPLTINLDKKNILLERFAMKSFSRRNKNYFATTILNEILNERFKKISKQKGLKEANVENQSKYLRGHIIFSKEYIPDELPLIEVDANSDLNRIAEGSGIKSEKAINAERDGEKTVLTKLFVKKITQSEFDLAKAKIIENLNRKTPSDFWFDLYTYQLDSIKSEFTKANQVTLSQVQKTALRLVQNDIVEVRLESILMDEQTEEAKEAIDDSKKSNQNNFK